MASRTSRSDLRRNLTDFLPEIERGPVDVELARAFANPNPDAGLRAARELARALQARRPGAAASLREGLERTVSPLKGRSTGRGADETILPVNQLRSDTLVLSTPLVRLCERHPRRRERSTHSPGPSQQVTWTRPITAPSV
jgi:hypothetical protein